MSGNPHQKYRPYLSLFQMKRILAYIGQGKDDADEEIISTLKLQIFKAENSLSVPASKPLLSRLGLGEDEFPEPKMPIPPIPSISPPLRETLTETEEDEIMKQLMNPMNSPKSGES